ncbi:uncharacterized protein [Pseudorasbora parva]|uniref:uncharacterized protein n=1 Tax=Pseudorasbora parva TaxID=51549 RepID=UPI00351E093F
MDESQPLKEADQALETKSRSSRSHRSSRSSASVAATTARAKAASYKVKASYAEKEASIMRERAEIEEHQQKTLAEAARRKAEVEADLYVLQLQKEAVAASTEAEVYEAAGYGEDEASVDLGKESFISSRAERTKEYVQKYSQLQNAPNSQHASENASYVTQSHAAGSITSHCAMAKEDSNAETIPMSQEQKIQHDFQCFPSNVKIEPFDGADEVRHQNYPVRMQRESGLPSQVPAGCSTPAPPQVSDFTTYLLKKEMVSSGLFQFDDCPENYWAWKTSFQAVTSELSITSREEIDLLVRWLGPDSSKHAKRIKSVHVSNPALGVQMIWCRLEDCYGCPEVIEQAMLRRLEAFPHITNKDTYRLRDLGDLLLELQSAKQSGRLPGLAYLDTARGVNPIAEKLPFSLQDKWITQGSRYKEDHNVYFPPFCFFVEFVCRQARTRNDPSFALATTGRLNNSKFDGAVRSNNRTSVFVKKTEIMAARPNKDGNPDENVDPDKFCTIHNKPHPLHKCRTFRTKHLDERKAHLKEKSICFRCCASTKHVARDCRASVKCRECDSDRHNAAMHPGPAPWSIEASVSTADQIKEKTEEDTAEVNNKCTGICGEANKPKSCSKICLVKVYPSNQREKAKCIYAVLDEQSNRSLAKSQFFDLFNIVSRSSPYTLKTCSGIVSTAGRKVSGFSIESLDGKTVVALPPLLECNTLPDDRSEIPTPEVALHFPHLTAVAEKIPPLDPSAPMLLLLGRDILSVHKVREQYNGPQDTPYAQRLDLGWVIVGEVCLDGTHRQSSVNAYKTNILPNGRTSFFSPCTKGINIVERGESPLLSYLPDPPCSLKRLKSSESYTKCLKENVFFLSPEDDKVALSVEDKIFLEIMDKEVYVDEDNHWVAPLPFRFPRIQLPNNREQAMQRLNSLQRTLLKKPKMKTHFFDFMQKVIENKQAEPAPPLQSREECWYLPIFGVYHPHKPDKIRVVFDSSAQCGGISLNDVLLSGPDLNNTLLGVLLRFRREKIAVMADIEQMFYCFKVKEQHRNYLRFLWHKDNCAEKEIIDYRMTVHVFGNSPSPAVAIYALRRAAERGESECGTDAKDFVLRNFYVDDGIISVPTEREAVDLLRRTQTMLAKSSLNLHKVASNSASVMEAFTSSERAKDLKDLDFDKDPIPLQRSLGISWNLKADCFTFRVSQDHKPFTRRGILSTVNSLYDPLGFVCPVTMQGKALVRELSTMQQDWDAILPLEKGDQWKAWTSSLAELDQLQIPRAYVPTSVFGAQHRELCVFSDASTLAIAAVAYLRVIDSNGKPHVGFVMGRSKLAPFPAHTVPRLELCAAVLAVELMELIKEELDTELNNIHFYTDSRIVLGYIHNVTRRFYMYVANRVARIRKNTEPSQWHFVCSEQNPADHATRFVAAAHLPLTNWFSGPGFLKESGPIACSVDSSYGLVRAEEDVEIHPQVNTQMTNITEQSLGSSRFERFSSWRSLVRAVTTLTHIARSFSQSRSNNLCRKWHQCAKTSDVEISQAKSTIIKTVQREVYREEFESLTKHGKVSQRSTLQRLDPFVDDIGLLRVGGRIHCADVSEPEKHPLIIPPNNYVVDLLIQYYHDQVAHQGRHFTEGAIRSAGLWIVNGKRLISSVIHKCVLCKKLRGRMESQKMSALPLDRVSMDPPFTHTGLDVFGPFTVVTRKTRGNSTENKRWTVIFSCLSTRAVHMEVMESLSASSFICALRRFLAVRGPVKHFRSDRGTNFVGAVKELQIDSSDSSPTELKCFLKNQGCTWTFNAPHSSHMGGVWERMIGIARRILDALLMKTPTRLTHEVLTTLMAEVMAIMNSRPLTPISTDAGMPQVLSPAMLLTQKASVAPAPPGNFELGHLHKNQWRQVQMLADSFWKRWKQEYLSTLQPRRKWTEERDNVQEGDVVLLKDGEVKRSEWPIGLITKTVASSDGKIRKVMVKTAKQGTVREYLRPICDIVLLLSSNQNV